ncbi:MAG: hypothetical protein NZO16_00590 [Deltaproteobacteria bacterium]|nr:hypothetical protein [Deltaproteobacteria bacterium]
MTYFDIFLAKRPEKYLLNKFSNPKEIVEFAPDCLFDIIIYGLNVPSAELAYLCAYNNFKVLLLISDFTYYQPVYYANLRFLSFWLRKQSVSELTCKFSDFDLRKLDGKTKIGFVEYPNLRIDLLLSAMNEGANILRANDLTAFEKNTHYNVVVASTEFGLIEFKTRCLVVSAPCALVPRDLFSWSSKIQYRTSDEVPMIKGSDFVIFKTNLDSCAFLWDREGIHLRFDSSKRSKAAEGFVILSNPDISLVSSELARIMECNVEFKTVTYPVLTGTYDLFFKKTENALKLREILTACGLGFSF